MSALQRVERILNHLDQDKVYYFGYGSNLSLDNFKQFKNINVISYYPGIINDWKLSFSLCYPTKSFANIHYSKGDKVHGVIMILYKKDLQRLAKMETSYNLKILNAFPYKQRNKSINVYTLIFDKKCENRIKNEIANNKNMKQVMRFFDINGGGKKPEKNYLDTIIRGAKELRLHDHYIQFLMSFDYKPILKLNPTQKQIEKINGKIWTMSDIKQYISNNPKECISILKGIVFDMEKFPPSWKQIVNGKDITMMYASRWAYANKDNCKSLQSLHDKQKLYINGELQKLLNGIYNVKILGKMNSKTYQHAYSYYNW